MTTLSSRIFLYNLVGYCGKIARMNLQTTATVGNSSPQELLADAATLFGSAVVQCAVCGISPTAPLVVGLCLFTGTGTVAIKGAGTLAARYGINSTLLKVGAIATAAFALPWILSIAPAQDFVLLSLGTALKTTLIYLVLKTAGCAAAWIGKRIKNYSAPPPMERVSKGGGFPWTKAVVGTVVTVALLAGAYYYYRHYWSPANIPNLDDASPFQPPPGINDAPDAATFLRWQLPNHTSSNWQPPGSHTSSRWQPLGHLEPGLLRTSPIDPSTCGFLSPIGSFGHLADAKRIREFSKPNRKFDDAIERFKKATQIFARTLPELDGHKKIPEYKLPYVHTAPAMCETPPFLDEFIKEMTATNLLPDICENFPQDYMVAEMPKEFKSIEQSIDLVVHHLNRECLQNLNKALKTMRELSFEDRIFHALYYGTEPVDYSLLATYRSRINEVIDRLNEARQHMGAFKWFTKRCLECLSPHKSLELIARIQTLFDVAPQDWTTFLEC